MAKNKLTKAVKKNIKQNTLVAVIAASLLINLFFFTGLVIYNSTTQIDISLLNETRAQVCGEDYEDHLAELSAETGDPDAAKIALETTCVKGDFAPYYQGAVNEYKSDLGY